MSIASRIEAIEGHIADDYNALEYIGADLTNVDKNIENIKNVLADIYDEMPKVTDTGTNITLENTRKGAMSITYKGDTQQDSTTGINLAYDITEYGKFAYFDIVSGKQYTIAVKLEQQPSNTNAMYTGAIPNISGSPAFSRTYKQYASSTAVGTLMYYNIDALQTGKIKVETFGQSGGSPRYTDVMIVEGTYTDQTLPAYEPYTNGASPNPDYPQEIHNVSGDNTIEICGEQLFDKDNVVANKRLDSSGNLYTDNSYSTSDFIKVIPSETYTLQRVTSGGSACYCLYDSNKTFISRTMTQTQTQWTISTTNATEYIRIADYTSDLSSIMLKKGNSASEYEPYTGQSQLISLGVLTKNLIDGKFRQGSRYIADLGNTTRIFSTQNYPVKSGVTYTLSTDLNTSNYKYAVNLATEPYPIVYSSSQYYDGGWVTNTSFTFTPSQDGYLGIIVATSNGTDNLTPSDIASAKWQFEIGSSASTYEPYTPIELNKISTYQDYIYKTDKWYLHKEIGKVVLDGTQTISTINTSLTNTTRIRMPNIVNSLHDTIDVICNQLQANLMYNKDEEGIYINEAEIIIRMNKTTIGTTESDVNTYLSNNNLIVYYALAEATEIEITDTTLLEQLETIKRSYDGVTNISQENNDLPFILDVSALKEWE